MAPLLKGAETYLCYTLYISIPDSKVHVANMGPIWGRQDPGGPHVGPMNFAIWDASVLVLYDLDIGNILYFNRYGAMFVLGDA